MECDEGSSLEDGAASSLEDGVASSLEDGAASPLENGTTSPVENGPICPLENGTTSPLEDRAMTPVKHHNSDFVYGSPMLNSISSEASMATTDSTAGTVESEGWAAEILSQNNGLEDSVASSEDWLLNSHSNHNHNHSMESVELIEEKYSKLSLKKSRKKTQPVLYFDEYGNLTASPQPASSSSSSCPTLSRSDISDDDLSHDQKSFSSVPGDTKFCTENASDSYVELPKVADDNKMNQESLQEDSNIQKSPFLVSPQKTSSKLRNGEVRAPRPKVKSRSLSGEVMINTLVLTPSDEELQGAFKSNFESGSATSRYGRARKKKTEDGFFFGTLNFNELRKITSTSPKKGKGSAVKTSPELKRQNYVKNEVKKSLNFERDINDANILSRNVDSVENDMQTNCDIPSHPPQVVENSESGVLECDAKNMETKVKEEQEVTMNGTDEEMLENQELVIQSATENVDNQVTLKEEFEIKEEGEHLSTEIEYGLKPENEHLHSDAEVKSENNYHDICPDKVEVKVEKYKVPKRQRNKVSYIHSEESLLCGVMPEVNASDLMVPSDLGSTETSEGSSDEFCISKTKSGRMVKKPCLMDMSDEEKKQRELRDKQKQLGFESISNLQEVWPLEYRVDMMKMLEKEHPCEYMVGDMVWVNIRGSPLWPALMSYDPEEAEYTKIAVSHSPYKVKGGRTYHVQFFSDNAQRRWIAGTSLLPFHGYDKMIRYLTELKCKVRTLKKYKRITAESFLKTLVHIQRGRTGVKHERWTEAIQEAEEALIIDRYERIQRYSVENPSSEEVQPNGANKLKNNKRSLDKSTDSINSPNKSLSEPPLKRRRGRPTKFSIVSEDTFDECSPISSLKHLKSPMCDSTDEEFSGFEDSVLDVQKRKSKLKMLSKKDEESMYAVFLQKNLHSLLQASPHLTEIGAKKQLRWKWKKMTDAQKARYKSKFSHCENGDVKRKLASDFAEDGKDSDNSTSKRTRSEEIEEKGVYRVVRNEKVCNVCETVSHKGGMDMVRCKGPCCGTFHLECLGMGGCTNKEFKCSECLTGIHPCFICKSSEGETIKCSVVSCGKFYHDACVKKWPQVYKLRQNERLICPRHICHMCAAMVDDMNDPVARTHPFTRCLRCPTTYHTGEECIAAGSDEISLGHHICTKHLKFPKNSVNHVNVNWCFCCSKGGSLLLCDQCPAAFHADCMKITAPEDGYVCEDCENGKFPIYGDVVWVKLGTYRWWPGQVLHPRYIPDNIENLPHQQGMFCVHFFGSNDYYWVTRGRTFLYQEGDKGSSSASSKALEKQFRLALAEAAEMYRAQKDHRAQREAKRSEKGNVKPPPFIKIDSNKPVGNVRLGKLDSASVNKCDCNSEMENPCGSDDKCINRMLMFECIREVCTAKDKCMNQRFQRRQYPDLSCFKTSARGWGLKTNQEIKSGEFVIEYVGELIDETEFRRRIEQMHTVKEENYYFLTIDKDRMIDAGPKGNLARFMNHSCQPNCETQKWTVGGDTRVGLFALRDLPAGTELTFNYNLECVGTEKKRCQCGSENCSGYIGVKVQKNEINGNKKNGKEGKRKKKRKRREAKMTEDDCFRCGAPGDLLLCDMTSCPKGYHLECLGLDKLPKGKWVCPWHHCDECGLRALSRCDFCPNSFCRSHAPGNVQQVQMVGNVCNEHDLKELQARSDGSAGSR
ncbi:histone-lysine N-methyltransferase NSD2-like isoform X2 [Oratosquilla oratoria]|uniref:histone-lysine N-methyltransferase NSD2-like isoform X2 n=1 Tax=Oratosquilla oratoria TaxID=337810 RepID=UPI003F762823